jgi:hypothetical protein
MATNVGRKERVAGGSYKSWGLVSKAKNRRRNDRAIERKTRQAGQRVCREALVTLLGD